MTHGKWQGEKVRESGSARAEEQVFRIRQLMPSGPVAESESRVVRNYSTSTGEKDRIQEQLGMTGKDGCRER